MYPTPLYKDFMIYGALALALISATLSLFTFFSLDNVVDRSVQDTVLITKVRIAELEAATALSANVQAFERSQSYRELELRVAEVYEQLKSVYVAAPTSEQSDWQSLQDDINQTIDLANAGNPAVVETLTTLIDSLRRE